MAEPARPAPPSYSAVWADAGRMLAANAGLVTAVAGVFLFLPAVIEARFFPPPSEWYDFAEWQTLMRAYVRANWIWILASTTSYFLGIISLYLLLLPPRITVGAAVARAVTILPFYVLLALMVSLAISLGIALLVVPGIFLIGKLVLATPIMIAETPRAPVTALKRSWERSKGRAWSIAGLVLVVYLAAALASLAVRVGLGTVILVLLGPEGAGAMLLALLQGLMMTAVALVVILVTAALYRAVSPAVELGKAS